MRIGETGFEPATSASRTQRSSQAELLSAKEFLTIHKKKQECKRQDITKYKLGQYRAEFVPRGEWAAVGASAQKVAQRPQPSGIAG